MIFRYTKVRCCIEDSCFQSVFDTKTRICIETGMFFEDFDTPKCECVSKPESFSRFSIQKVISYPEKVNKDSQTLPACLFFNPLQYLRYFGGLCLRRNFLVVNFLGNAVVFHQYREHRDVQFLDEFVAGNYEAGIYISVKTENCRWISLEICG